MSNETERLMITQLECYLNVVADMKECSVGRIYVIQVQCTVEHCKSYVCLMFEVHFQSSNRLHGLCFTLIIPVAKENYKPVFNPRSIVLYFSRTITSF
jgi:hypothetical protein